MASSGNLPLHPALRFFSAGVIVVLIVGAGLFIAPGLVKPRWPWAVTPFNARFLGGFYIAEMVVMATLLFWNRWAPGRLVLWMAFVFTLVASIASFLNLGYFDFARKSPWIWFAVYLVSVLISGLFLAAARARPAAPTMPVTAGVTAWMRVEGPLLALYGIALLLLPLVAARFWPWPIDRFHAQVYSAVFLSGAAGVILLSLGAAREEMLVLGLAETVVGVLSILGLVITDMALHRVTWSSPGTIAWVAIFIALAASGLHKLTASASRALI
ncbi:MAG TPA: hypothetical protein VIU14_04385 [Mesorhizobium sp.]